MKHWKGFVIVWILFFLVVGITGYLNKNEISITGNVPLTGILKEDPTAVVQTQEYDISFGIEEEEIYKLRDLEFWVNFVPKNELVGSVEISYFVLDSSGNIVYFNDEVQVISEELLIERDLDNRVAQEIELPEGDYTFGLSVSYGEIKETFSENFILEKINPLLYSLKQLFDIRLDLDSYSLDSPEELSARVTFENFGQEDTPVNLTFFVYDIRNVELYRNDVTRVVETEDLVLESFPGFSAAPGRYRVVLRTLYNVGVEDYFEQEFVIKDKVDALPFLILGILFVAGVYFVLRGRRKDAK